ncbi:hypothetical protein [Amycolatopsis thermoflava]|uniref:hypothetical protein n=1 Tax=Amycolatopsis thermoflava TaxID=84480 RepID=UPI003F4A7128
MIDFKIVPEVGEPYDLKGTTRDVLNWEKTTKGASLKSLMDNPHMADMYRVAHFAAKRTGNFAGSLQEFESSVDLEFEFEEAEKEPDPTR